VHCGDARQSIDAGREPGSETAETIRLGFHLAGCPACRAYRDRRNGAHDRLMADLILVETADMPAPAAAGAGRPAAEPRPPHRLRHGIYALAVLALLLIGLVAAHAVMSLLTIRHNVQAMIVPTSINLTATPIPTRPVQAAAWRSPTASTPPAPPTPTTVAATPFALPTATPIPPDPGDAITVLLIGSDQRLYDTGPARADALMLARIDPDQPRVALLSLTRDMMVDIPGYGYARVNAANVYGGPELTRQAVSRLVGLPVDHYVAINFAGFIEVVDALGGVVVSVEKDIFQPGWDLYFPAGPNQMDGLTALRYSRIRMPDSDYERVKRQQAVLLALANRVREQNPLAGLDSVARMTSALRDDIQTDMPEERMLALAWALRDFPPAQVERYAIEEYMVSTNVLPGDHYAQVADEAFMTELRHLLIHGNNK
jgi:polyisoprenyl-teichoic acid--peptidoglycan teichoic acid transferase